MPVSELGYEALYAVRKTLVQGRNAYTQKAEDLLEMLKLRNGKMEGDDLASGMGRENGADFHYDVEAVLDALALRLNARSR